MKARDQILAIIAFGIFVAFAEVVAANGADSSGPPGTSSTSFTIWL
jgi:hypothetical protein